MSKVSKREIAQMQALADERAGRAGMVQCPGCPAGHLVPDGGEFDGHCPRHWHQGAGVVFNGCGDAP
jgi:hypothetical protein